MANISQMTFSNSFYCTYFFIIIIQISMKFVHMGPTNGTPALFQMIACRRPGAKPFWN